MRENDRYLISTNTNCNPYLKKSFLTCTMTSHFSSPHFLPSHSKLDHCSDLSNFILVLYVTASVFKSQQCHCPPMLHSYLL